MEFVGGHCKGFVTSKAKRTSQKIKEKLKMASKTRDKEYTGLLKKMRTNQELSKKPMKKLLKYMSQVRQTAIIYRSLCQTLKNLLEMQSVTGQEPCLTRLNMVQDDLHMQQAEFISILDELSTWIRNHRFETEKEMSDVKYCVKVCEERRLELEVVKRKYPMGHSAQDVSEELYKEAKYRATEEVKETLQTNIEAFHDVLVALHPKETEFEITTSDNRASLMLIFQQLVRESPVFAVEGELEIRQVRKWWNKLCKDLERYCEATLQLFLMKSKLHSAVIAVIEGQRGRLHWFSESKREMVKMPAFQLGKVRKALGRMREKLEVAQVMQDMVRSTSETDADTRHKPGAQLEGVMREVPKCLEMCLIDIRKVEEDMRRRSHEVGRRIALDLDAYSLQLP